MAAELEVSYFNTFLLKRVIDSSPNKNSIYTGVPWEGVNSTTTFLNNQGAWPPFPVDADTSAGDSNWVVEEARIQGGYNNNITSLGVKAHITEDDNNQQRLFSGLIYSGIFNSRTGINELNVFSVGQEITRSIDPAYGSIQRLFAEDTNLSIFQENKVSKALIDKDAIYAADGVQTPVTTQNLVIGQITPYLGHWGISNDPRSFGTFGYRKYFADKNRGTVMRLSRDGLTQISEYGMKDFFRDRLAELSDTNKTFSFTDTVTVGSGIDCLTEGFNLETDGQNLEKGMTISYLDPISLNYVSTNAYVKSWRNWNNAGEVNCFVFTSEDISALICGIAKVTIRFNKVVKDRLVGGWDIHNSNYVLSIQKPYTSPDPDYNVNWADWLVDNTVPPTSTIKRWTNDYYTLTFDEEAKGWTSFFSYAPTSVDSLKANYFTTFDGFAWKHYVSDAILPNNRGTFYTMSNDASITFIFNPAPSTMKNFQTVSYEGNSGWEIDYFESDLEGMDTFFEVVDPPPVPVPPPLWQEYKDTSSKVYSYYEGEYDTAGNTHLTGAYLIPPIYHAGFDRQENDYVANLVNNSTARPEEIIWGSAMSGIKGYIARVKISTDSLTDPGGPKELWTVGSNFVVSSQ